MALEPVNQNVEIQDYVPPKHTLVTYTFILVGNRGAAISVWKHVGDTVEVGRGGWIFNFPRLKTTISINRAHYVSLETTETEKVYVDAVELQKAIVKDAVEKAAARKVKKHGEVKTEDAKA